MTIVQGDKVVVPKINFESIVESVFSASGNEYVLLKGKNEAFFMSEVIKVNDDVVPHINNFPVPADVNQPIITDGANEKYDIEKDDRPEEYKEVQEYDCEEIQEDSIILTKEEFEMITNTLENTLEILSGK